jgi:high-affinity K+ transport system ATPase subunit B
MRDIERRARRWSLAELICGLLFGCPVGFLFAAVTITAHVHPVFVVVFGMVGYFLGASAVIKTMRRLSRSRCQSSEIRLDERMDLESKGPLMGRTVSEESMSTPNDPVTVKAGELIPFNGIVVDGFAEVDESAVCGVSKPALIEVGDGRTEVYKDTLVVGGELKIIRKLGLAA